MSRRERTVRKVDTHTISKTMLTVGEWRLMRGPCPWYPRKELYFMHHDCSMPSKDGNPFWHTWFVTDKGDTVDWCEYCHSEPPQALIGMVLMMEKL